MYQLLRQQLQQILTGAHLSIWQLISFHSRLKKTSRLSSFRIMTQRASHDSKQMLRWIKIRPSQL